jgi:hypothetical protein
MLARGGQVDRKVGHAVHKLVQTFPKAARRFWHTANASGLTELPIWSAETISHGEALAQINKSRMQDRRPAPGFPVNDYCAVLRYNPLLLQQILHRF